MTFEEAEAYLYSFIDYEKRPVPGHDASSYDLESFRGFLASLDSPHLKLPTPILIAGTKGKGSTAALLAAALTSCGHKVGLFTSPHLESIRERIRIGDSLITEAAFASLVSELEPRLATRTTHHSYRTVFEILTTMAFLHFLRNATDIAILEVGLGGRLDATNVVEPAVSVITPVSLDHTERLGKTVTAIAREKAGIIRKQGRVVSAAQCRRVTRVIRGICEARKAELRQVGIDARWEIRKQDWRGSEFRIGDGSREEKFWIPLAGNHQVENAAAAYLTLQVLKGRGMTLDPRGIRDGFRTVRWPGRLEVVRRQPWVLLDGAHNVDSARKLRQAVRELYRGRRVILILGISQDKDLAGMLRVLLPMASVVVFTRANHPRGAFPEHLRELAAGFGHGTRFLTAGNAAEALERSCALAGPEDLILGTGSIYLVGDLRGAAIRSRS